MTTVSKSKPAPVGRRGFLWWRRGAPTAANPAPTRTVCRERSEHSISRRDIDPDALKVLYRLDRSGFIGYLVGGGVRDLLLGRKPKDFDIGTDAHPGQIKRLFRNCFLIGRRFRLAHIRFGTKVIETSTFRRLPDPGEPEGDGDGGLLHHHDNTFGTPVEDAQRRDFTVNGMFYDIRTFQVIDHVGGLDDLDRGLIRSIGDPNVRFREDPVRMLRAVRFAARLGFAIEPDTWQAILRHHAEILKSAPPRLLEEISRLCGYRSSETAFRMLRATGLLGDLFPEIEEHLRREGDDEPYWRYLRELDLREPSDDAPPPLALLFSVLAYPLFLSRVREIEAGGGHAQHLGIAHEVLQPISTRLNLPRNPFFQAVHILECQRRFTGSPHRGVAKRFASREMFEPALRLRRFHLRAEGRTTDDLQAWAAHMPARPSHAVDDRRSGEERDRVAGRRRRPRRRGGGSRRGATVADAQQGHVAE